MLSMHNQIRPPCFLWMDRGAPKCLTHRGKYKPWRRFPSTFAYSKLFFVPKIIWFRRDGFNLFVCIYRELGYYNATSITFKNAKKETALSSCANCGIIFEPVFDGSEWGPWRMWWRWFLHRRLCVYIIPWANNKLVMSASSNVFDDWPLVNRQQIQIIYNCVRRICCAVCWVNPEMMKLKTDGRARGDRMDFSQRDWLN